MTTTTQKPEIGQSVVANGIRTNYLRVRLRRAEVVLIHGSGPGVTAYSNWRLVLPALGEDFHVLAPDMVGFGYSDRPGRRRVQRADLGRPDRRVHGRDGHQEGAPGRQQLRRRHRAADRHPAPRAGRQDGADGQHGRALRRSPRAWTRSGATRARSRACARCWTTSPTRAIWSTRNSPRCATRPAWNPASRSPSRRCSRRRGSAGSTPCAPPEEEIRKLPHRTLIMHGREDKVIPVETSLKLEELIDNADLSVFSHCGHWSMIERTADFNRLVRDFFLGKPTKPVITGERRVERRGHQDQRRRHAGTADGRRRPVVAATRRCSAGSTRPWC